jgi:hemolysin activation/secretion protein
MFRRRRPLMGAAMIGGTAYVAHKAGQKSAMAADQEAEQEARLAQLEAQQAAAAPAPAAPAPAAAAPAGGTDIASKLVELKGLMDQGVLSPDEFEAAKQKLLAG